MQIFTPVELTDLQMDVWWEKRRSNVLKPEKTAEGVGEE